MKVFLIKQNDLNRLERILHELWIVESSTRDEVEEQLQQLVKSAKEWIEDVESDTP